LSEGEEFYDPAPPPYPQQGDIYPNVPLVCPPPSPHIIVLREDDGSPWSPKPGCVLAIPETAINSFDGAPEYIVAVAERGLAAVLTQTCDLPEQEIWLVAPLRATEGTEIDLGNLVAGKYANLFAMPRHPKGYFDMGFADISQCFTVHRESLQLKDRVAALGHAAQHALNDKVSDTLTRVWGHAPGEEVRIAGKYRCIRCFQFVDLENAIVELAVGMTFPDCPDCVRIKKQAQWRLLRKHKRY
jgi:hypothetical protein